MWSGTSPARPPLRRRLLAAAPVVALLVAHLAVLLDDAPGVGHFRSAAGHADYDAAYERAFAALPEPDATLDLRTSFGVVRAYRFDGADPDADPLVLLPGTSSATPVWADNLPSLLEVRSVWSLDLLGEPGKSVAAVPVADAARQAEWLAEALDALPADRVHLVGLSIGGWSAANLAAREPATLASVTLLEPVLVFGDLALEAVIRSIPASIPWLPRALRDDFSSWTAGGAPVEDEPVAETIELGMQTYAAASPAPARIADERLADLDVPVLAILGGDSPMHDTAALAETAREHLPDDRVLVYRGASHAINGEHPERIAADIAAFVESVETAR